MACISNQEAEQGQNIETNNFKHEEEIIFDNSIEPYYSTLLSIFPNIDSKYIRQICKNPPFKSNENDKLQMFVNHLLTRGDETDENSVLQVDNDYNRSNDMQISDSETRINDEILSQIIQLQDLQMMEMEKHNEEKTNDLLFSEFLKQDEEVVDEKMNILEAVLPDADPEFLRKFVKDNHENPMLLEQFVESSLINKNYGKRDKYYAKMKTIEKIKQYTTGFTVEEFVKQFPDPFEYFEDMERQGQFDQQAFNFLNMRYFCTPEQYLANIYSLNNYNLSLADKQIQLAVGPSDAVVQNIEINNIILLQEIAFIQNKHIIKAHLDHLESEKEKELHTLRAKNLLLECQCCYNELKPTECIECDNNHIFCRRCVNKGTNLAISNGQTSVLCFVGCKEEISLSVLRKILPDNSFDMLMKKRQEAEVEAAQLEGLVTCPFCPYQMELGPQIKIFTCKNPECMKITCRSCRKINHLPIRCEDVLDEHKGRLYIQEEMSKALIRNCHKCQRPFVKSVGCNKMTCICGAQMCYICRQPYTNGISHGNCSKDSQIFDQELVETRRAEATAKLRGDFPDMNIPRV